MNAIWPGLFTGLSLIVAIGAQNAFVLRQGLTRRHIFAVVFICSLSDALLITLGTAGLGALIQSAPLLLEILRWLGVAYLSWFGISAIRKVVGKDTLQVGEENALPLRQTVLLTLGFTFLNPHVYLDTVILVGGLANQFANERWYFALGAVAASFIWFFSLGVVAGKMAVLMARPAFWKILDVFIAAVMFSLTINLALGRLA